MKPLTVVALSALALASCGREPDLATADNGPCDASSLIRDMSFMFAATIREPAEVEGGAFTAGEPVVVGGGRGGRMCAYSAERETMISGWVPLETVEPQGPVPETADVWSGAWRRGETQIVITPGAAGFSLTGSLAGAAPGFDGEAQPSGGALALSQNGCGVTVQRVGPWLVAVDNRLCSPAGETFSGVYRKAS